MTTDFRMVWEALTTCPGNCSGCNIDQKTNLENGLWDIQKFKTASYHTKKLLKKSNHNNRQKIFLAAGDYLYLSEEQLTMIFDIIDDTLDKDAESRIVLFTTSAIGKIEMIKEKIDIIQRLLIERNLDCSLEVVFDFAKIKNKNYWPKYIDSIQMLNAAFPITAINIQVGDNTFENNMNQLKLQDFIEYCSVTRIEFVITPHSGNAQYIKPAIGNALSFMKETVKQLELKNNAFFYPHTITIKKNLETQHLIEKISIKEELNFCLNNYQVNSLYINHGGTLTHFYSGLSNIYPFSFANDQLAKLNEINIFKNMYIEINKEPIIKNSVIFNNRVSSKNKCSTCKFQKNCHSMGNMIIIHNLELQNKKDCPLNIYEYLDELHKLEKAPNPEYEKLKSINTNYKEEIKKRDSLIKDVN